jgi:hypothetical protein
MDANPLRLTRFISLGDDKDPRKVFAKPDSYSNPFRMAQNAK